MGATQKDKWPDAFVFNGAAATNAGLTLWRVFRLVQPERTAVFKEYNENAGGNRHPMRGVETPDYLYLFNPWSDGEDIMRKDQ